MTILSDDRFAVIKNEVATLIIKNVSELEDAIVLCAVQTSVALWKYAIRLEIQVRSLCQILRTAYFEMCIHLGRS